MFYKKDFISSNKYTDGSPGYKLNVFGIRHHQDCSSAQTIKIRFEFRPAVPAGTNLIEHSLLLTKEILLVKSDGRKQFASV